MSSAVASAGGGGRGGGGGGASSLQLPYGYHIDLDFISYCENLTNLDLTDGQVQRRQRRRQRQSMEVMLGIQQQMQRQMDSLDLEMWSKTAPEPPPRTHHHLVESPIVPRYNNVQQWDASLNDVVHDFERTLERSSKRVRERREAPSGDCIPSAAHKTRRASPARKARCPSPADHPPVESIDGSVMSPKPDEAMRRRVHDLEEQTKLIPLLQLQIQALRDERHQLQQQLRDADTKSSSSSPQQPPHQPPHQPHNHQQMFHAHRVSPVQLAPIKSALKSALKSSGTNTSQVLHRDVGTSPIGDKPKVHHRSISTDFILAHDAPDGGRLYTERDLKRAIEMAHARMRKASITIGTQVEHVQQRSIAIGPVQLQHREIGTTMDTAVRHVACETDEPHLMVTSIKGINIVPVVELPAAPSVSLKDLTASRSLPSVRSSMTQTLNPMMVPQGVQHMPKCETRATQSTFTIASVSSKATDTQDLSRCKHKMSMTEAVQRRDQTCHTLDLLKLNTAGTNTPPPDVPILRSTASNTNVVTLKSIGIQLEVEGRDLMTSSKIPRPSPNSGRKFVRQNTFTVQKQESDVEAEPEIEPEMEPEIEINECPAEKLLRLTMVQSMQASPLVPPIDVHQEKIEEEEAPPEVPEGTSKIPMSPSIEYLDDDDDEEFDDDDDDKFNDDAQLMPPATMRPPPTSISTIRLCQQDRVKIKPTKEMVAALKVLNDNLQQSPEPSESQIRTAKEVASCEWFRISSVDTADPLNVEDYLDFYEEQSWDLLTFMVNLTDKNGNTAMHYAVSHGNFDVVSILLDSKVSNINQTNNAGYTCVMLVSLAKLKIPEHCTVVQRLFKLSDVNIRATKNSQTALMLAVSHGNLDMVQMLIEAGADINIQDDDGSTALMCSAEHGHIDIVKYLLAQPDCDSTKQDVDGSTALKISLEAGYHDIGCLLYAHEHLLRNKSTGMKRASSSMKSSTSSLL